MELPCGAMEKTTAQEALMSCLKLVRRRLPSLNLHALTKSIPHHHASRTIVESTSVRVPRPPSNATSQCTLLGSTLMSMRNQMKQMHIVEFFAFQV